MLAGFLHGAVRERALADLSETVGGLLIGGGAARVKVAGPAALLERLKSIATPGAAPIEFTEHDAAEVTVAIDETVVETNIGAWMERIDSATRGEADG